MSITQTHTLAALQVYMEADVPALLWGPPGTGKTTVTNNLAVDTGAHIETVMASLRDPSDFAGLPVRTDEGVVLQPPSWAKRVAEHAGRSVVFFDEVNTAPPAVQAALLRVVLDKVCGDFSLGEEVRFVAAANEAQQAAGGWDLAPPLANRFGHLDWPVDVATVASGLAGGWESTPTLSISSNWRSRVFHHGSIVGAFIRTRPDLLEKLPEDEVSSSKAFPTPRSWDRVCRVLAVCEASNVSDTVRMLAVAGLVGDGAAAEFLAYARDLDLPDPETLLSNPDSFVLPERLDKQYAIISSVAAAVVANVTPKRWESGMKVFVSAVRAGVPDVAASGVMMLSKCRPNNAKVPSEVAEFAPLLRQAGLL